MMLNISFDFDESTHKISNIKVNESGRTLISELKILCDHDMRIVDNKLQFTNEALEKLGVGIGDRVAINYWYTGPNDAYPIISKADVFEGSDGNKLTKSKTISFRGEQRDTLLKYGTVFSFEEWMDKTGKVKDGVFKLIPVKEDDSCFEEKIVDKEESMIETEFQNKTEDDAEWLMEL